MVELKHDEGSGTQIRMIDQIGVPGSFYDGSYTEGFDVTLDDDAAEPIETAGAGHGSGYVVAGVYRPYREDQGEPYQLSEFDGEHLYGRWTLEVFDEDDNGKDGTLERWGLTFYSRDGIPDAGDNCPYVYNPSQQDADSDGIGDVCDNCPADYNAGQSDADTDGVGDVCDNCPDHANPAQEDCDDDGVGDACTIANCGGSPWCDDCNTNAIPDECDIDEGTSQDCNTNGIPDPCDIGECDGSPWCDDCNANTVPDECDIENGTSQDCNTNSIPDQCDSDDCGGNPWCSDCNTNGVLDWCDIDAGTSQDVEPNGIPDECEYDSDGDGLLDMADVCPTSPAPAGVDPEGRPLGDLDGDCDVDLNDFAILHENFSGPQA